VLEIAPGYGRWTRFLIPSCSDYLGIDLSPTCIDECRKLFQSSPHARFEANDGTSLDAAADGSIDLVFSFDSLVHAELEILEAYIPQILKKLAPNGVAFIHHSNLADGNVLEGEHSHSRAETVSGKAVTKIVERHGGVPLVQETVNWMNAGLIDCFSLFANAKDYPGVEPVQLANFELMHEASLIRKYQTAYAGGWSPTKD
jgi:cyclopropane fatty-acyl-phospholipid synthase-like methyltransferase